MEKEKILSGFGMMIAGALILTAALITAAVYAELVQSAYWPIIGRYGTSLLGTGGFHGTRFTLVHLQRDENTFL
ncbi:MAG TPA: hypothetical protein GX739_08040 [Firmicutes bacterium]|nr:hypothetical protein [Bacillota bacterium]